MGPVIGTKHTRPAPARTQAVTDRFRPPEAWRCLLVFLLVLSGAGRVAMGADAPRPSVGDLEVVERNGEVGVSYIVLDVFTEDDLNRLHSGIPLSFRHRVELLGKRWLAMFNRRGYGRTVVITAVSYDTLTRRYDLQREIRGKEWPKGRTLPDRVDKATTSSLDEVKTWMSTVDAIPLPAPPESAERVKVKVRSELGKKFVWQMFPSTYVVSDEIWLEP